MGNRKNIAPLKRLAELISGHQKEIAAVYFYAILSGLLQLSVPIGIQAIIGFVLGASMVTSLYVLIFLVVTGVFLVGMMQINQMKIIEKIQQRIFTQYAFDFAEKIPRFDLFKVDSYYLPEKVNYFFDATNVQKGLSKLLLDVPAASIQILFGLLLLSLYHPLFIVFGVLLISILWLILKITGKKGLSTSMEKSTYKYTVAVWLEEMARVIKSFKFSQGTHLNLQKNDTNVSNYLTARTAHFNVLLVQYRTLVFFKVAITAVMLIVGTYLLLNQQLNIGEFIAAEIVILMVINAVEKLINSLNNVYDVVTGLEKLAIITESPLEKEGELIFSTTQNDGIEIEMIDFTFAYQNDKPILKNLNLHIPAHKTVCVSTKEGSGRSTFLKVLTGNYSNYTGSILLNKMPLSNYQLESLRNKIGIYLNQQDIFLGTVWENISMGRDQLDPNKVIGLAKELGLKGFNQMLPDGLETLVDPTGKKLSSTLIRYILLLRAFYNEPNLLLLEEPWEGLEHSVREHLIQYLLKRSAQATLIIASNDRAFAKQCDYHIELVNGSATMISNK
ncbi:MAG: peptidase domain-containing ABC transporter [Sphingobacteriaceae bacterium]